MNCNEKMLGFQKGNYWGYLGFTMLLILGVKKLWRRRARDKSEAEQEKNINKKDSIAVN